MYDSRKQLPTGLDGQEQRSQNARHHFRLASSVLSHISVKPYLRLVIWMLFCISSAATALADTTYWTPWVTDLKTNSATINWLGEEISTELFSVEYATKEFYDDKKTFQTKIESLAQGTFQHIPIAGLEPNTSYVYKVTLPAPPDSIVPLFPIGNFKTMPVSGPFTFLVISDSHAQEKRFKYVAHAIAKYENDALFILDGGDYASADQEEYWTFYFNDEDASKMLAKFPIFNTIGNHEYHRHPLASPPTHAVLYHDAFNIADGKPLNYSFDCSGIRFVILNSPDPSVATGTDTDPQASLILAQSQALWLKEQLDNNMAGTFTMHHHPIWNYGKTTMNPLLRLWETLYLQYDISANFAGHVHNYQRYSVRGIPHFIVGNGGGVFNAMPEGAPHAASYQFGETMQLGYLKVTVDPENNNATAQEIFVASVTGENQDSIIPYTTPIVADTVNFPLSSRFSNLTVSQYGEGTGIVASYPPYDIYSDLSSPTCSKIIKKRDKLVLMAVPDSGSVFKGWIGDGNSKGQQCHVNMSPRHDLTVIAIFDKAPTP